MKLTLILVITLALVTLGSAEKNLRRRNPFVSRNRVRQARTRVNNNNARQAASLYSSPKAEEVPFEDLDIPEETPAIIQEARASVPAATGYGAPVEARTERPTNNYGAPVETRTQPPTTNYGAPVETRTQQARTNYGAPAETRTQTLYSAPVQTVQVVRQQPQQIYYVAEPAQSSYVVAQESVVQEPIVVERVQQPQRQVTTAPHYQQTQARTVVQERRQPIAIVRSNLNAIGTEGYERSFRSSFVSENGIQQSSEGELKTVGDSEVMVMKGSYSYTGNDGLTYVVDWYADETGYHPSAPHLPQPVEIPFEEQAIAVEAQLRFAEEQRALGVEEDGSYNQAGSEQVEVVEVRAPATRYLQPVQVRSNYGAPAQVRTQTNYGAPVEVVEVREQALPSYGYRF